MIVKLNADKSKERTDTSKENYGNKTRRKIVDCGK